MADNVQPGAGEQREESSGLLLSVDPLHDLVPYKLAANDDDEDAVDDSDGDTDDGDGTGGDDSDSDDGGETLLVVEGAGDSGDSDSGDDSSDDSDGDASDSD
jgi:hypothetical protein